MSKPPSVRWPWIRGGLGGLVTGLLPLVWVAETSSCGDHPGTAELTGVDVASNFRGDWWLVGPLLLVMVLTPWGAGRLEGAWRFVVHVVGLLVTGFVGYGVYLALLFTIFTERALKGAGFFVAASAFAAVGDALFRAASGAREAWEARKARLASAPTQEPGVSP